MRHARLSGFGRLAVAGLMAAAGTAAAQAADAQIATVQTVGPVVAVTVANPSPTPFVGTVQVQAMALGGSVQSTVPVAVAPGGLTTVAVSAGSTVTGPVSATVDDCGPF